MMKQRCVLLLLLLTACGGDELKDGKMQKAVTFSNGMELLAALGVLPKPAAPPGEKERP